MGRRQPLSPGTVITMPNGGKYVIQEKVSEGGLSLIYAAVTQGNQYPVMVKEFFPAENARRADKTVRASDGTIRYKKLAVCPEAEDDERFSRSLAAFAQEGALGSSARLQNFQIIAFSDCGSGYAIMPRWSADTCSLYDLVEQWSITPPRGKNPDPVFTDNGRVQAALGIIRSLLTVLSSLHGQNILHLDISPHNVVWAGQEPGSGGNGSAFLADFGCAVLKKNGEAYPREYVLSYSARYAAPEYNQPDGKLDERTDLYAVGRLLLFLCRGNRAMGKEVVGAALERNLGAMRLALRHQAALRTIIQTATAHVSALRYESARQMQAAVESLLGDFPRCPINADGGSAFTLYSLRSMLEGSLDTRYSWAQELCDRRGVKLALPDHVHQGVSNLTGYPGGHFPDDETFLRSLLPEKVFNYLKSCWAHEPDPGAAIRAVMSGTYPQEWKLHIASLLSDPGSSYIMDRFIRKCNTLLSSQAVFYDQMDILSQIPGEDIAFFNNQHYLRCGFLFDHFPCKALTLLAIFALLGPGNEGYLRFADGSVSAIIQLLQPENPV